MKSRLATLACAGLLAACGGGGDSKDEPPVAQPLAFAVLEDGTHAGQLTAVHPGGKASRFELAQVPAHGVVSVQPSGAFTYMPYANYHGADGFVFRARVGDAVSGGAQVSVTVESVNDAPRIGGVGGARYLDPATLFTATVTVDDIDGAVMDSSVTQLSGPALAGLAWAGDSLSFTTPANGAGAAQPFRVELSATDELGAATVRTVEFTLVAMAPSGVFRTLVGSTGGTGFHLVIVGDGYRADELDAFRGHATALLAAVLDAPEVAAYKPLWNVHLLDVTSNESGVDVPSEGVYRDTAFDATLDCAGIARLLCADQGLVAAVVTPEFAAYDQLLLISNTGIYGGAGGTGFATTTRNEAMPYVAQHELGHSYAGLGDEYDDLGAAPAQGGAPRRMLADDGLPPNITNVTDRAQVKWRHWFDVPGSGVDLFEGAHYQRTGYYRPTQNSFMRALGFPMGAVNAETWALAGYTLVPALERVAPAADNVATPFGQQIEFEVSTPLGASVQQVRWYVDGVERPAALDQRQFTCCASAPGLYTVIARVADITGTVRKPGPHHAGIEHAWLLEIQP